MSLRGEFCRVLDKYKSGAWDRDRAAAQLEKYFKEHTAPSSPSETLRDEIARLIPSDPISPYDLADEILSALLNKLPEKVQAVDIQKPGQPAIDAMMQADAYNEAIDLVRQILEGKE